ncbi:hypothetical protein [Corallococcus exercitus]|uniref:hypothetical protein n=1 Tax=Corallococcus exercitus TaxID=2316736 RepID=UPI0035D4ED12
MKCIYAIPPDASEAAKKLARRYTEALSKLAEDVIALGDDLRAFAESHGAAVLKLDDDDWTSATEALAQPGDRELAGELFWSPADAQRLRRALDEGAELAARRTVSAWLGTQAGRERSILLVAA